MTFVEKLQSSHSPSTSSSHPDAEVWHIAGLGHETNPLSQRSHARSATLPQKCPIQAIDESIDMENPLSGDGAVHKDMVGNDWEGQALQFWKLVIEANATEAPRREMSQALQKTLPHDEEKQATYWQSLCEEFLFAWRGLTTTMQLTFAQLVDRLCNGDIRSLVDMIDEIKKTVHYLVVVSRSREGQKLFFDQAALVEKCLVSLCGHEFIEVRNESARLLNMLYDGTSWQYNQPLKVIIGCVGDMFHIKAVVPKLLVDTRKLFCEVAGPCFDLLQTGQKGSTSVVTLHEVKTIDLDSVNAETMRLTLSLQPFSTTGFYDWRFVVVSEDGKILPICDVEENYAQGRYIIHPSGTRSENIHEIIVDTEASERTISEEASVFQRKGFRHIVPKLKSFKSEHVTSLYIFGALERDNAFSCLEHQYLRPDACPSSVVCRRSFCSMLGGEEDFQKVIAEAKAQNIRILVQCSASVSAGHPHERYRDHFVFCVSEMGEIVPHRGSDGRSNQWEDQILLNYRKVDAWNVLIEDIVALAEKGVGGIVLNQAQSWPIILEMDKHELLRVETDGSRSYHERDLLEGSVVYPNAPLGFWENDVARAYPNPLLIKICRSIWARCPNFLVMGEAHWGQEDTLFKSGVIPYNIDLAAAIGSCYGKEIEKEGIICETRYERVLRKADLVFSVFILEVRTSHKSKRTVDKLRDLLERQALLPEGAIQMHTRSIASDTLPYPCALFGRGAWAAVDLMYYLPGIPFTFAGEKDGHWYRSQLCHVYRRELKDRLAFRVPPTDGSFTEDDELLSLVSVEDEPTTESGSCRSFPQSPERFLLHERKTEAQRSKTSSRTSFGSSDSLEALLMISGCPAKTDEGGAERMLMKRPKFLSMPKVHSWSRCSTDSMDNFEKSFNGESDRSLDSRFSKSISEFSKKNGSADCQELNQGRQPFLDPGGKFDLSKVKEHYAHHIKLRLANPVLCEGKFIHLVAQEPEGSKKHSTIISFARWRSSTCFPKEERAIEIAVIAINFSEEKSCFTWNLRPLGKVISEEGMQQVFTKKYGDEVHHNNVQNGLPGYWKIQPVTDPTTTKEGKNDDDEDAFNHSSLYSTYEFFNSCHVVRLKPSSSICWFGSWVPCDSFEMAQRRVSGAALGRLQNEIIKLRPCFRDVGVQPAPEHTNEYVLGRIQFNSVYRQLVHGLQKAFDCLDEASALQEVVKAMPTIEIGERHLPSIKPKESLCLGKVLRETIFYAAVDLRLRGVCIADVQIMRWIHALAHQTQEQPQQQKEEQQQAQPIPFCVVTPVINSHLQLNLDAFIKVSSSTSYPTLNPSERRLEGNGFNSLDVKRDERTCHDQVDHEKTDEKAMPLTRLEHENATLEPIPSMVIELFQSILTENALGRIVFTSPELGRWSTVGGLGVMVDELTIGLAQMGVDVTVISPYYDRNRLGKTGYLIDDSIVWTRNIHVSVASQTFVFGVHEGRVQGVHVVFLHNRDLFPCPYPNGGANFQVRLLTAFSKATLETLCQLRNIPAILVTNDWMTGFTAAYARSHHFGVPSVFETTSFLHIVHNLDTKYEGRQYPAEHEGDMYHIHTLAEDLLVDPYWGGRKVINPSRAAILTSHSWATVSLSYRDDLLHRSPLCHVLQRAKYPFAHSNGVPVTLRRSRLLHLHDKTHVDAKKRLQEKYFGRSLGDVDDVEKNTGRVRRIPGDPATPRPGARQRSIPLLAFVGRITEQKGVHLILECAEHLIGTRHGDVQILVGGSVALGDSYGQHCARRMQELKDRYPQSFWADPTAFFMDGPLVNLGADFGLMPSLFEPGGIVQHEFFVAGTPVIAFKTGGLKDTVFEFDAHTRTGNGFTFDAHTGEDLLHAIHRALSVFEHDGTTSFVENDANGSSSTRVEEEHDAKRDHWTLYESLRKNAAESVMDISVVAREWLKEFCRLRHVLLDGIFTMFTYVGPHRGEDSVVHLVGSFHGWQEALGIPLVFDAATQQFKALLSLPAGTYAYKFIVDTQWVCSSGYPTLLDDEGNMNNVVTVASAT